ENVYHLEQRFDVVFDTVGKLQFKTARKILKPKGVFLTPVLSLPSLVQMIVTSITGGKRLKFEATGMRKPAVRRRDLIEIRDLLANGKIKTVIDRTYSFDQIKEAAQY
ncbi:MAG: zinc-binding dehydrogenase, partial [Bacteroidia bacterium]|nr:zinc-binding dehydrogenase [Bacteroidia bacterium]